jgi:hypothetical protein
MTREYQRRIRNSPLWPRIVQEHGLARAEALLHGTADTRPLEI